MADEVCYTRMFSGGLFVCLFAVYLGFFKNIFVNAKLDKPLPTTPMASAFAGVIHQIWTRPVSNWEIVKKSKKCKGGMLIVSATVL